MTSPTIRIRAVEGGGVGRIPDLLQCLQSMTLPGDTPMPTNDGWWWLAFVGDQPVAFAGLSESQHIPNAGYLCRAGVLPEWRGMGLQRRLVATRERKARQMGMTELVTDTYDNPYSSNNLIKCGFKAFDPPEPYGAIGTNYWRKPLNPK